MPKVYYKGKLYKFPYTRQGYRQAKTLKGRLGKKRTGVPKGFRHVWKYVGRWNEKKLKKGLWKFSFRATKGKRSKSYGSFGKGTTGAWKIHGTQYIRKTGKGTYQTNLIGYKKPLRFNIRRK